jgi:predicted nucleic acid-binding protein
MRFEVLIDSDAFIAWLRPGDLFHAHAQAMFTKLAKQATPVATTSLVVLETATVLSHREGTNVAKRFLDLVEASHLPVIHIDAELQQATIALFKSRAVKGTSMVDCANAVVAKRLGIPQVFSFDHFYRQMGLRTPA